MMELYVFSVLAVFIVAIAIGMPVFLAMGISATLGMGLLGGVDRLFENMALGALNALNSYTLLAVPLYILTGTLMEATGLSSRLFTFASVWVQGLRGGLGVATLVACSIFAAISGSSVATAATIGLVALPALAKSNYPVAQSGALIAAGGTLGILIPPSIGLLIFGVITDQSIGALFIAGVIPGVLIATLMAVFVSVTAPRDRRFKGASWAEKKAALKEAGAILALPLIIFIGIYGGFASVTEVGAIAVAYVLVVGFAYRRLGYRELKQAGRRAVSATVMIMMLMAFGSLLTQFFTQSGVPQSLAALIADSGLSKFAILTIIIIFYLILGMFLEAISMMLLTVPILFPIMTALGIDPLVAGIFVILAVEVAQITPPVGINLFIVSGIGKIPFGAISKAVLPYVLLMVAMMYLVLYIPSLSTWLPATMGYGR